MTLRAVQDGFVLAAGSVALAVLGAQAGATPVVVVVLVLAVGAIGLGRLRHAEPLAAVAAQAVVAQESAHRSAASAAVPPLSVSQRLRR